MNRKYYVVLNELTIGPVTERQVLDAIQSGKIPGNAEVCAVGATEWSTITEVEPFASALCPATTPSASVGPAAPIRSPRAIEVASHLVVLDSFGLAPPAGYRSSDPTPKAKAMTPLPKGLQNIGPATMTALNRNGIKTAYDALAFGSRPRAGRMVAEIPGMGPARWEVLLQWASDQVPDVERSLRELRKRATAAARSASFMATDAMDDLAVHTKNEALDFLLDDAKDLLGRAKDAAARAEAASAKTMDSTVSWKDLCASVLTAEAEQESIEALLPKIRDATQAARDKPGSIGHRGNQMREDFSEGLRGLADKLLVLLIAAALFVFILYLINPEAMGRRLGFY